jgi:CRISPR type III-B/RAMP module RAMP protein Cmr1
LAAREWKCRALTDIWTGDASRDASRRGDRLIATGLLGSIRWWFEVLVRGLGGRACDPTLPEVRCPAPNKIPSEPGHHCVVCELFGCTGWARKFRFDVLDETGQPKSSQIKAKDIFILRFTELRPIREEEWCLLDLTLRLIAEYGAIGGKTVLKPSDEPGLADLDLSDFEESNGEVRVRSARRGLPLRSGDIIIQIVSQPVTSLNDLKKAVTGKTHGEPVSVEIKRDGNPSIVDTWFGKRHHRDYGLMEIIEPSPICRKTEKDLRRYVSLRPKWREVFHSYTDDQGRRHDFSWASLTNFWCVKGRYLARQNPNKSTFNQVIGRQEPKNLAQRLRNNATEFDKWLAGRQQESKKVFSFKEPPRTFGFVNPGLQDSNQRPLDFNEIRGRLEQVWPNFQDSEFFEGQTILQLLLSSAREGRHDV